jgi:hypothetical protein
MKFTFEGVDSELQARIPDVENKCEIMLTSVDNGGIRLNRVLNCLNRRNFVNLFCLALKNGRCSNLGEGSGLYVGIYSKCERHPDTKERKGIILQVMLKASPMTDVIVSLEP